MVALVIFAFAAGDAEARGGRGAARALGGAAGAAASGPVLSQAELRRCLDLQDSLDVHATRLKANREQLDVEEAKLVKASETIKQRRESLDRTDEKAVNAFNAVIRRLQKQQEDYKGKASAHNEQVVAYQREASVFKESCAGKAYRESDMNAVLAAKK